jgi:transposase
MDKYIKKTKVSTKSTNLLKQVNATAAGIDIGAHSIFVCVGKHDGSTEVREIPTFTADLLAMVDWLKSCGTTSVAMESTGVYWIPPYDILEQAGFDVILVNAYYLKTVPGRKTDVKDCQWIQQLHSYGLLRGSFRPDGECITLRGYVRQRSKLVELASSQINLMHKSLVQMNIQLHQVVSHITGVTGMNIIRAIVAGERDPVALSQYRNYKCRASENKIAKALEGNFRPELVLALQQAVEAYDFFNTQIAACEQLVEKYLKKYDQNDKSQSSREKNSNNKCKSRRKRSSKKSSYNFDVASKLQEILAIDLTEIPGLNENSIVKILSETGTDMTKWPSAKHFASWLGLCPGNKISGSKLLSGKSKPTANKAAQAFRMAANSLYRSSTALGAYFRRMRGRLGGPKAITAAAHKLAKILYYMLRERKNFQDIGQAAFEQRHQERTITNLRKRAAAAGFELIEKEIKGT